MGKYFSATARYTKAQEFLELKQGAMIVIEYVARFTELARFSNNYVATDAVKVRRFENGLDCPFGVGLYDSTYRTWTLWLGQP